MLQHLKTKKKVSTSNIQWGGNKDLMSVTWSKKSNHQTFGGHGGVWEKRGKNWIIKRWQVVSFAYQKAAETPFPTRTEEMEHKTQPASKSSPSENLMYIHIRRLNPAIHCARKSASSMSILTSSDLKKRSLPSLKMHQVLFIATTRYQIG